MVIAFVDMGGFQFVYRSVSRYAMSASRSASLSCIAGISEPGLMASGSFIQRRRFAIVFSAAPEAIVLRLMKWARSGPKRPFAAVPLTVWQLMQEVVSKTRRHAASLAS